MSQATTCWCKGKKKEKRGSREGVKGCSGKCTQDPSSSLCTKHFIGQSDPLTLFVWTWVWTSEWLSSKIQSLKLSQGFLTFPTASETSIASGNNEKQIRSKKSELENPCFFIKRASTVQMPVYHRAIQGFVWKQTPGLFFFLFFFSFDAQFNPLFLLALEAEKGWCDPGFLRQLSSQFYVEACLHIWLSTQVREFIQVTIVSVTHRSCFVFCFY